MGLGCVNLLLVLTGLLYVANAGKPEQVLISGGDVVIAGVSSVYECSALCTGVCNYTWNVDDQTASGRTFTLTANGVSTSILMICTVRDEERKYSVSYAKSVEVINPYSVKPSRPSPSVDYPFKLTCNGATPAVTIIWLRDGEPLTLNSWMSLSPDNITLSFRRLEKSDSKQFQCRVLNGSASVISKDYWIDFKNYQVRAERPSQTVVGIESVFTCTAECGVFCTGQWAPPTGFPKGRFFSKGPEIRWTPSEAGQTQVFTCDAVNPSLGKLANISITVTVMDSSDFTPRPRPNNAISVKSSAAAVICATLLMLICAWN